MSDREREPRTALARGLARLAPVVVVGAAITHCLWLGWGRWGNPLLDTGRELEWPRRILEGEGLYTQLRYFYGPLAPYLNALLYWTFGVHLEVLAIAGAVCGALTAATVYLLSRRFIGRAESTLVALTFVYVCAFAQLDIVGIFNFVLPYSYSATYGMLAALASLLFLLRHLETGNTKELAVSVASLVITAFMKLEPLFPIAVAHSLFVGGAMTIGRLRRAHVVAYAAGAATILAVYGGLTVVVGPALWRDHLGGALNPGSDYFIRWMMGVESFGVNLRGAAASLLLLASVAGVGACASALQRFVRGSTASSVTVAVSAACGGTLALPTSFEHPFRALPVVLAAALVGFLMAWWRRPKDRAALLAPILLAVFALAAIFRIALLAIPQFYGFFMLPAALVSLAVLWFRYVPRIGSGVSSRRAWAAAFVGLLLVKSGQAIAVSSSAFSRRPLLLSSTRGRMWVGNQYAPLVPILDQLAKTPPTSTLLVVPHTGALNFLSGRRGGSDGMFAYLPMDFYGNYEDAAVRARWEAQPPAYLVVFGDLEMREFGGAQFGTDYATKSARWLQQNYWPVSNPDAMAVLFALRSSETTALAPVAK